MTVPRGTPRRTMVPCELEAIHAPGFIQPHATLLCIDPDTFSVLAMAGNAGAILAGAVLSDPAPALDRILPPQVCATAVAALGDGRLDRRGITLELQVEVVSPFGGEAFIHRHRGVLYCEVEPRTEACPPESTRNRGVAQAPAASNTNPRRYAA